MATPPVRQKAFTLQPETLHFRGQRNQDANMIQSAFHKIEMMFSPNKVVEELVPGAQKEVRTIDNADPITVGTDLAQHYRVRVLDGTFLHILTWSIEITDPPVGDDLIVDFELSIDDGTTWDSIFPAGNANKIVLPDGGLRADGTTFFTSPLLFKRDDILRYNVIQVGSVTPGSILDIVMAGVIVIA